MAHVGIALASCWKRNVFRVDSKHLWVYSSAVERLTADQQVPGSNPGAPFFLAWKTGFLFKNSDAHFLISHGKLAFLFEPACALFEISIGV